MTPVEEAEASLQDAHKRATAAHAQALADLQRANNDAREAAQKYVDATAASSIAKLVVMCLAMTLMLAYLAWDRLHFREARERDARRYAETPTRVVEQATLDAQRWSRAVYGVEADGLRCVYQPVPFNSWRVLCAVRHGATIHTLNCELEPTVCILASPGGSP